MCFWLGMGVVVVERKEMEHKEGCKGLVAHLQQPTQQEQLLHRSHLVAPHLQLLKPPLSSLYSISLIKTLPSFSQADTGVQPTGWEGKAAAWLLLPDHQPAPISGWIQQQCGSSHPRAPLLCQGHTGSSEPDVKSSATSGSLFSPRFSLLFWSSSSQRYMQGLPKCSSPT